jgi:hypothetical protein
MQFIKVVLSLFIIMSAHAEEKAVYVGEGRYVCGTDSVDCVVLKQRNEERMRRIEERDKEDRRNEQMDWRERQDEVEFELNRY